MMKNATRTGGVFCTLYTEGYMVSFRKGRAAKEILLCLDGEYYEEMEGNSGSHLITGVLAAAVSFRQSTMQ